MVYLITPESAVTGNREQKRGFRQLYFSLLMSVFFRSPNSEGTGNREQGTEKRFQATLLFVTYVGFFPFT
ncbi:MAG: hypothetical protein ACKPA8_20590 [Dolichospermum sp.]